MITRCYIALGSNVGRREGHLRGAVGFFSVQPEIKIVARSSIYETPALLPDNAPKEWDVAYLNQVIGIDTALSARALLEVLKQCEQKAGRQDRGRWGPRELDCDLLYYGEETINEPDLIVPHSQLSKRDFVLVPLCEIAPKLVIPDIGEAARVLGMLKSKTVPSYRRLIPELMGIVNVTPDSFSDGGVAADTFSAIARIIALVGDGADWIDIGAESTRPGAVALTPEQEWQRLGPVLEKVHEKWPDRAWKLSVDTYHPETAAMAIKLGVDAINDVSGVRNKAMLEVLAASNVDVIAMHSLTVPADPEVILDADEDVVEVIIAWARQVVERIAAAGIDPSRLILDPGIGFGKSAEQSQDVMMRMHEIIEAVPQLRWLVGHSRKSFLRLIMEATGVDRDAATLVFSEMMAKIGIDILRVHDVSAHRKQLGAR